MSTFTRSIPFLALCLCGLMMSGPASAEIKMGVVNFQKLLEDAPQTKTAMQALENEFAPRRRELLTLQNDLKARDEKLQKEGAVMSEADRAKAEKALRDQQREFSRKAGEFQDDAGTRKNEEIGKVQRYLVSEIRTYATAQGYDLVLGEGVFFAKGPLDITANVLAVLATKPATLPAAPASPSKPPASSTPPAKNPSGKKRSHRALQGGAQLQGEFSLGDLAVRFGLALRGEPELRVSRVATLSHAGSGTLSFLANPRYRKQMETTRATAVLVGPENAAGCPVAALIDPNPYLAYARIAELLHPQAPPLAGIHPTAVVSASARIAASAGVGPLAVIGDDADIGEGVFVGPGCIVQRGG